MTCVERPLRFSDERVTTTCQQVTGRHLPLLTAGSSRMGREHSENERRFSSSSWESMRAPASSEQLTDSRSLPVTLRQRQDDHCRAVHGLKQDSHQYATAPGRSFERTSLRQLASATQKSPPVSAQGSPNSKFRDSSPGPMLSLTYSGSLTVKGFVPEGLQCTKCGSVLRNPVQLSDCGDRYCKECALALLDKVTGEGFCVRDKTKFSETRMFPDKQATKELCTVPVICSNKTTCGCPWEGTLAELQGHLDSESCSGHRRHIAQVNNQRSQQQQQYQLQQPRYCRIPPTRTPSARAECDGSVLAEFFAEIQALRNSLGKQLEQQQETINILQQEFLAERNSNLEVRSRLKSLEHENTELREQMLQAQKATFKQVSNMKEEVRQQVTDLKACIRQQSTSRPDQPRACSSNSPQHMQLAEHCGDSSFDPVSNHLAHFSSDNSRDLLRAPARDDVTPNSQPLNMATVQLTESVDELDLRVGVLEHSTNNGRFVWKVGNFLEMLRDAQAGRSTSLYSPHFCTHPQGYKLCLRMYPNGDGGGKDTHLSLFLVVMKGEYDAILAWPIIKKVTFRIWDQSVAEPRHRCETFGTTGTGSSFVRPVSRMNVASGVPKMISLADLTSGNRFLKNDTIFIECNVTEIPKRSPPRSL